MPEVQQRKVLLQQNMPNLSEIWPILYHLYCVYTVIHLKEIPSTQQIDEELMSKKGKCYKIFCSLIVSYLFNTV